jgi:hypothetical protein
MDANRAAIFKLERQKGFITGQKLSDTKNQIANDTRLKNLTVFNECVNWSLAISTLFIYKH